jgi:hypothetical protein
VAARTCIIHTGWEEYKSLSAPYTIHRLALVLYLIICELVNVFSFCLTESSNHSNIMCVILWIVGFDCDRSSSSLTQCLTATSNAHY